MTLKLIGFQMLDTNEREQSRIKATHINKTSSNLTNNIYITLH